MYFSKNVYAMHMPSEVQSENSLPVDVFKFLSTKMF